MIPQEHQRWLEGMRPEQLAARGLTTAPPQPPQMQKTFTIRNDVNLKKNTLKLVYDEASPANAYVEFAFDASTDCAISIYFAALETSTADGRVRYTPLKESTSPPTEVQPKGLGQVYRMPIPVDFAQLSFEELTFDPAVGRHPMIVSLESRNRTDANASGMVHSQSTYGRFVRSEVDSGRYKLIPVKQKIQVGSTSYELQEIYGIEGQPGNDDAGDNPDNSDSNSRECVICMTEPRDTTVLPCRHMCMCSDCAKVLRVQSNKCPICRTGIDSLLQIKISKQEEDGPAASAASGTSGEASASAATTDPGSPQPEGGVSNK